MNKTLSISISLAVLIIAIAIFYYFSIFLPNTKNQELLTEQEKQESLNNCLEEAQTSFELTWDSTCSNGIGDWINICQGEQGEGCSECILPDDESEKLNLILQTNKDNCYKQYK